MALFRCAVTPPIGITIEGVDEADSSAARDRYTSPSLSASFMRINLVRMANSAANYAKNH